MDGKGDDLRKEADAADKHAEKDTIKSAELRDAADQHDAADAAEKAAKEE
jgi:hypothetical protein